jgi:hypothetical protein
MATMHIGVRFFTSTHIAASKPLNNQYMKSFAFFALLLCSANVLAQTPAEQIAKLQKDPNVIWIGEIYRDYEDLNNAYEGARWENFKAEKLTAAQIKTRHIQSYHNLKLLSPTSDAFLWEHYLSKQVCSDAVEAFTDADLTKPLNVYEKNQSYLLETSVRVFDPETYSTIIHNDFTEYDHKNISCFRIRQLIYYSIEDNLYHCLPLSVGLFGAVVINTKGEKSPPRPLFWLPVAALSQPLNLKNTPDMPFIKRAKMYMPFAEMTVLKSKKTSTETNNIMRDYILQEKNKLFLCEGSNDDYLTTLDANDISRIFMGIGAMTTLNPETLKTNIVVDTTTQIKGIEIIGLTYTQQIGWDDQNKIITIAPYSFAPNIEQPKKYADFVSKFNLCYIFPHQRFIEKK